MIHGDMTFTMLQSLGGNVFGDFQRLTAKQSKHKQVLRLTFNVILEAVMFYEVIELSTRLENFWEFPRHFNELCPQSQICVYSPIMKA